MKKQLCELEEMVIDAWPASETSELSGWLLRASGGPSRRGNSVATLAVEGELSLDARIDAAEAWYRERAQPALFQVGPCAAPKELDQALAARGYQQEGQAALSVAQAGRLVASARGRFATRIDEKLSEGWLGIVVGAGRFAQVEQVFRGYLTRLGSRCRFVTAYDDDGLPVAGCLAIASEDRLGIYAMLTLPGARRMGAARSLLRTLGECALREELRELYLLVETDNEPARALYAQCGFQDVYTYHYRASLAV